MKESAWTISSRWVRGTGRLREMASDLQTRAAEQEDQRLMKTSWRISNARFGLGLSRSH
jgi:hypothetical protein